MHRARAGEFCGGQLQTPKEQYLSINLSGTRTALDNDASGKRLDRVPVRDHSPPMGKGARSVPALNLSGARRTGEDRGRGPAVLCPC
jgi:hypothetical protein